MEYTTVLNACVELFGRKWKADVVWILRDGPKRFSEIKVMLPKCSVKVLSQALQQLEHNRLIDRKVVPTSPPKVVYGLTENAKKFVPVIKVCMEVTSTFLSATESISTLESVIS